MTKSQKDIQYREYVYIQNILNASGIVILLLLFFVVCFCFVLFYHPGRAGSESLSEASSYPIWPVPERQRKRTLGQNSCINEMLTREFRSFILKEDLALSLQLFFNYNWKSYMFWSESMLSTKTDFEKCQKSSSRLMKGWKSCKDAVHQKRRKVQIAYQLQEDGPTWFP